MVAEPRAGNELVFGAAPAEAVFAAAAGAVVGALAALVVAVGPMSMIFVKGRSGGLVLGGALGEATVLSGLVRIMVFGAGAVVGGTVVGAAVVLGPALGETAVDAVGMVEGSVEEAVCAPAGRAATAESDNAKNAATGAPSEADGGIFPQRMFPTSPPTVEQQPPGGFYCSGRLQQQVRVSQQRQVRTLHASTDTLGGWSGAGGV